MNKNILITLAVVALIASFLVGGAVDFGEAPSGLATTVATTSVAAVTSTATSVFATSTNCTSRVISTQDSVIMLTFSDYAGQTPSATFGYVQGASTTVVYDSGQYGCGLVKAYSFEAQDLTVTETR